MQGLTATTPETSLNTCCVCVFVCVSLKIPKVFPVLLPCEILPVCFLKHVSLPVLSTVFMKLPSSLISYFLAIFLWNSSSVLMFFYSEFLNVNIFYFPVLFFWFFYFILFQPYMYLWWRFLICCSVCSSWKLSWDRNVFMRVSRGIKDRFGCGQEAHWGNSRGNSIIWNWDSISAWKKPHEDLVEVLIRKWPGHFPRQKYSSCKTSQSQLRNQSSSWKKPHEQLMKKWANFLVKKNYSQ